MDSKTTLKLDIEEVLRRVEEITGVKLPRRILEVSLLPEDGILYIRFSNASNASGEPLHPLIHAFYDEAGNLAALEIIDINKLST